MTFVRAVISKLYPRAYETKVPINHPSVVGPRKAFVKASARNFILLQLLFFGLFSYIFGSLYQQNDHVHNFNILYVDYDGGLIGNAVRDAYKALQGAGFPTLMERPGSDFPTPHDLEESVCKAKYWGALYISPGASSRLQDAISGGTTTYNRSDILAYIWNEARYATAIDSGVSGNIQILSSAARIALARNSANATQSLSNVSSNAIMAFANPWDLQSVNIQETTQGARAIYNTLVIILILIQDFFYLGAINGLYDAFKIYLRISPLRIVVFRNLISAAYTMFGSLFVSITIWAFRSGWKVNGNQFALTWIVLWLFAHINFLTLDVFSVWLPPPYVPMALISWVVFNVTSILLPFELSVAFYRWAYLMPAHETYNTLIDIWSRGCNPQLRYTLPILFALEISGLILSGLGVYRRSHYAAIAEESQKKAFQLRIDTAMAVERQHDERKRREREAAVASADEDISSAVGKEEAEADLERDKEEIATAIEEEDNEIQRIATRASRKANFGPAFPLAMNPDM